MSAHRSARRGAQAVEFALVLPVFLMLTSGIVDLGWYFHRHSVVATAVRDAARRGSIAGPTSAETTAQSSACSSLFAHGLITTDSPTCTEVVTAVTGTSPDETITVTATVTYNKLFGLTPAPPNLESSLALVIEQ